MPTTNPHAPVTVAELDDRLDVRFAAFEVKMTRIVENAVTSLATTFHEAMLVMYEHVDQQGRSLSARLDRVEATMVTKSYLDERLSNFKNELHQTK